jgi:uncharacterized membrane protein required for colicin V production
MNLFDLFAAGYVILGFRRGRKRGASEELYRLVRTGLALLGGLGLFAFVRSQLVSLFGLEGGAAGAIGFLGSFAAVFTALHLIRVRIHTLLKVKCSSLSALAGGIIGAVRAGMNSLVLLFSAILADLPSLNHWVVEGAFIGKLLHFAAGLFS